MVASCSTNEFNCDLLRADDTAYRFVKKAQDTITSWVITAFSLDTFHGIGVIEQLAKVISLKSTSYKS